MAVVVNSSASSVARRVLGRGGSGIQDLGNVRMIHHGQRLPFRFEMGNDPPGVHAQLDDFERHVATHRLGLLGDIHYATVAFADFLQ